MSRGGDDRIVGIVCRVRDALLNSWYRRSLEFFRRLISYGISFLPLNRKKSLLALSSVAGENVLGYWIPRL